MTVYRPPILDHMFDLVELCDIDESAGVDVELLEDALREVGRLVEQVWAPTNHDGDVAGCRRDASGSVAIPEPMRKAYHALADGGWTGATAPAEYGGGNLPFAANVAIFEMLAAGNMSLSLLPMLSESGVDLLLIHGDEEHREKFLRPIITGRWSATMCLTEPQAGSDLGLVRTKATAAGDGSYRVSGTKIFITMGEHDATENIVHMVLARLPDAPAGTKGISLFIVPKFLVNDDGSLGERNDVSCRSIEHKMGINASPTCVMGFGDNTDGAVGYLVGEPHQGMRLMFTMMNNARVLIGASGLGIATRAYQAALAYALERRQGRALTGGATGPVPIASHADVRRMLMIMSTKVQASRALLLTTAANCDHAGSAADAGERERFRRRADLLIPVAKAWSTDVGVEVASLAIQVYGGAGYIEETGVPQFLRDARIQPIYEGTNGVQALDLIGRKLPADNGRAIGELIADMRATCDDLAGTEGFEAMGGRLERAVDAVERATQWMLAAPSPVDAAAGASDFTSMLGIAVGGWLLARSAIAAARRLAGGGLDAGDVEFAEGKIASATFYAVHILPAASSLHDVATAGAGAVFALSESQLAL